MGFVRQIGIAVLTVVAALLCVEVSTASAEHEVVLCKELAALCPTARIWPDETTISGLATNSELLGTLTVQCEDSVVAGQTPNSAGNPLSVTLTDLRFGTLPTPTLGEGCTNCSQVHVALPAAATVQHTGGKYFFKANGTAHLLSCTIFKVTCAYTANIKAEVTHTGLHATHSGTTLPVINILQELDFLLGSGLCGDDAVWHAKYIVALAENGGEAGLAWPSLGVPEEHEIVLCKELTTPHGLCPENSFHASGTKLLALASNTEFKAGSFKAVKCEDSVIEAETTSAMGATLGFEITSIEFGTLPTPELGKGCTSCTSGVHSPPAVSGSIEAGPGGDYVFNSSEAFEVLGCFGLGITCVYGSDSLVSLVDPDSGKHSEAPEENGYAEILVSGTLSFIKGSNFCPESGLWTANYVVYAVEAEGKATDGWLALYEAL